MAKVRSSSRMRVRAGATEPLKAVERSAVEAPRAPVGGKKYRVCLPETGTMETYTTGVLGKRVTFRKGTMYLVSLRDAKLLKQAEILPGRKVFNVSEVIPELEDEVEEVVEEAELVPKVSPPSVVDLTI